MSLKLFVTFAPPCSQSLLEFAAKTPSVFCLHIFDPIFLTHSLSSVCRQVWPRAPSLPIGPIIPIIPTDPSRDSRRLELFRPSALLRFGILDLFTSRFAGSDFASAM